MMIVKDHKSLNIVRALGLMTDYYGSIRLFTEPTQWISMCKINKSDWLYKKFIECERNYISFQYNFL